MSRFYYYLLFVNMFTNIIAYVPVILINHRKDGAITSMLLAIVIGVLVVIIFTKFFNSVPGKTLPDLLKQTMPKWFTTPFLFVLAVNWFIAGLITLVTFTILLIHFLTPELSPLTAAITILLFVTFGCFMKADRILYLVEIVFVFSLPLILFIFFKSYTSEHIEWDYIKVAFTFINKFPSLVPFMGSMFVFLGVGNLIIFNQFFTTKQSFGWKQISIVIVVSFGILFTTYFIPIGFNGFDNSESVLYPWITTSDSMRIRYGIIERVSFIFMLFYLAISVISLLIHWHVSIELLKSIFNFNKLKVKNIKVAPIAVMLIYTTICLAILHFLNEFEIYQYTTFFYIQLGIIFPILLVVLWIIKRRLKHAKQ